MNARKPETADIRATYGFDGRLYIITCPMIHGQLVGDIQPPELTILADNVRALKRCTRALVCVIIFGVGASLIAVAYEVFS